MLSATELYQKWAAATPEDKEIIKWELIDPLTLIAIKIASSYKIKDKGFCAQMAQNIILPKDAPTAANPEMLSDLERFRGISKDGNGECPFVGYVTQIFQNALKKEKTWKKRNLGEELMWAKDAQDLRPKEKLYELKPKSGDLLETERPEDSYERPKDSGEDTSHVKVQYFDHTGSYELPEKDEERSPEERLMEAKHPELKDLTPLQREVLDLRQDNLSDRQIGEKLGLGQRKINRVRQEIQEMWRAGKEGRSQKEQRETSKRGYYSQTESSRRKQRETTVMQHRQIIGFPLGDVRLPDAHLEARSLDEGV